jgi:K+-transporting ATPase c subunit
MPEKNKDDATEDPAHPLVVAANSGLTPHAPAIPVKQWVRIAKAAFLAGRMVRTVIELRSRGRGRLSIGRY